MSSIEYEFFIWQRDIEGDELRFAVQKPFEVLVDLNNLPSIPDAITAIQEVLEGKMEAYEFGWHRCGCIAFQDTTEIHDFHAEDLGTEPFMTVPTTEILKMLEEFWAYKEAYESSSRHPKSN